MQASARARMGAFGRRLAADELAKDPTAAATRLAARPSRRASRRGGGLMRRDSFKRLELEGWWVPCGCRGNGESAAAPGCPPRGGRGSFSADDHGSGDDVVASRRNSLTGISATDVGATYTEEDGVHIVKIQAATRGTSRG